MMDLNEGLWEVRIGRTAELRETKSGKSVANFSGACHSTSDADRPPIWASFVLWDKAAEKITPWLTKGRRVLVKGHLTGQPKLHKTSNRNSAEAFLTKEAKGVFFKALDAVANGDPRAQDREAVVKGFLKLVSTQPVITVDRIRFMDYPEEETANTGEEVGTAAVIPGDGDDIPF